jgi:hypothetical protein
LTFSIPLFSFSHKIQHYSGQLAKDTSKHLQDLNASPAVADNRQWRLQKERLHSDFTKALNNFQAAQRTAAQKEKEAIKKEKAKSGGGTGNLLTNDYFTFSGLQSLEINLH